MTTLWQASQQLQTGESGPEAFTAAALQAVRDREIAGECVFINRYETQATQQAHKAGVRWKAHHPLSTIDGLPISIKDLFDVEGEATTAGPACCRMRRLPRQMPAWWRG
ncbi:amidase family protein [Pantoea sp. LMR881]|uniref:amidase family protein n=1 Tax=Pantoea sp. LMR881 TaxID=3014336 RepID=UPI0022AE5B5B|nr:amidase family protein [Pantoea sp. LMR881]MCZ4060939.1 amidase family protein [Pantoea sp. LMR881]